jgi:chaperonin GroEL
VALLRCVSVLDEMKLEGDQAVGVTIVKRALEEPIRQIVVNAGVEGAAAHCFNAATEEYTDMIEAGIIDPTKVTRTALQNAASIAGLMITTKCVIADKPEEDKMMGGMPGGMGGGMGGMGGGDMY